MKKISILVLFAVIMISSCARLRENRAAHNQPFKPHQDKKMKQKHHR